MRGFRRGTTLVVATLAAGCLGHASDESSSNAIRFVDATGDTVALSGPARRIVSLVPSASETLRAMGAIDLVVGRTDFDKGGWTDSVPSVGGGIGPNLETLIALHPDLVIRFGGPQDPRTPERLDALGIPHAAVRPDRIEDIYETARLLGAATKLESSADSVIAAVRMGLAEVTGAATADPPLRIVYALGGSPPWVAGPDTYIDQIIRLLGGVNAFDDLGSLYSAVSPEQLRVRGIDVVLVSSPESFDAGLTPGARVLAVGDDFEIPGPGVVDAVTDLARRLRELEPR